ncbi:MAG: DNA polymerase I [Bacteroidales bacterium]
MPANKPSLFLIDGSSQMHRAFHAPIRTNEGSPLHDAQGRPTNAVYIFVTMLRKLLNEQQPQYIAASFDLAGPTFRSAMAADYKANRTPMADELALQIPWVHEACEALGVPIITREGYEADDVIATIATRAAAGGYDVVIVTPDKDLLQLVQAGDEGAGGIRVFNPRDEGIWYDVAAVTERFGVPPDHVVDILALTGDAIDNIKGVTGVGDKGARDLINQYGSLEEVLAHAGEIPQKKYREALMAQADDARQSRELARVRRDVPVEFEVDAFRYRGPVRDKAYEIFASLGFRSLLKEFAPSASTIEKDYALIETADDLRALVEELARAGRFAFRVLQSEPAAMRAEIVGVAFSTRPRWARYVPVGHRVMGMLDAGASLPREMVLDAVRPVFENAGIRKIGHDLKLDLVVLARHGIEAAGLDFDTMIASYLLDATRSGHPLEETALEHLTYKALGEDDVCGRGAKAARMAELPPEAVLAYAGERADLALQLADHLAPMLAAEELERLYRDIEMPLVPVLATVERAGIRVDPDALSALSTRIDGELATRTARIFQAAGEEFNINSPRQLGEVLFEKLKLPALRRTGKTKSASTAVEVLEELALSHELPRQILEWRALMKLKGTYIDALPQLINRVTGRVHTCFNQAVAATGRLSSSDPNLQNIPIRTELGREIRGAFVADEGHVLISADYSQIELRVLAHLSGDQALAEAFRDNVDIHDRTALKVFGPDSGIDPHELRRRAKIVNYALLYGKTAFTLARDIGVTQQAAQEFIDAYFAGFPGVRQFIDRTLEEARQTGVVKTLFGRRRAVPELTSRNGQLRQAAERVAVNMPIQGTAADILKRAMIDAQQALDARNAQGHKPARMILTVHDELLFEAAEADADAVAAIVKEKMESAVPLSVPVVVDVGIGKNWKEAKE